MYDCNYSEFDAEMHAQTYIDYLEVVITNDGVIHYAHPSHTIFVENLLKQKFGEEKFKQLIEQPEAYNDYGLWLCRTADVIMVWNNFYRGTPNKKQIKSLILLKETKDKLGLPLYKGEINERLWFFERIAKYDQ